MHSFGLHSPNISFPAVTQKGACSDYIVHSFAFHYLLDEMQILVDMRHMTSNDTRACSHLFEAYFPHDTCLHCSMRAQSLWPCHKFCDPPSTPYFNAFHSPLGEMRCSVHAFVWIAFTEHLVSGSDSKRSVL